MTYFRPFVYVLVHVFILQHTGLYAIVSKGMRLIAQGKDPLEGQRHTCGMGNLFHYHSTGYPELDEIMRTPQPLIFIMELLQVRTKYWRSKRITQEKERISSLLFQSLHFSICKHSLTEKKRFTYLSNLHIVT